MLIFGFVKHLSNLTYHGTNKRVIYNSQFIEMIFKYKIIRLINHNNFIKNLLIS